MDALRSAQPHRLFPPRASLGGAKQLIFRRRRCFRGNRQIAAALLVALGWVANSITEPLRLGGQTVDENFILSRPRSFARCATGCRARPWRRAEAKQDGTPSQPYQYQRAQLPSTWQVIDVQLQTLERKSAPRCDSQYSEPWSDHTGCSADERRRRCPSYSCDGRAYSDGLLAIGWYSITHLMGPAAPDKLEREAKGMEVHRR